MAGRRVNDFAGVGWRAETADGLSVGVGSWM